MIVNTLKAHKLYIGRLEQKIAVDKEIAKRKLSDAKAKLKINEDTYARYQNLQLHNMDEYKRHHNGKLEHYQNLIAVSAASIESITREIVKLNSALPTREAFVKLVHSYLETALNAKDLIEEDAVYREVVSNLYVKDNVVSVIKLNPPYDMMVDFSENSSWSTNDDASRTSEILESLYLILISYEVFQKRVQKTKLLLQNIVKPDNFADIQFLM